MLWSFHGVGGGSSWGIYGAGAFGRSACLLELAYHVTKGLRATALRSGGIAHVVLSSLQEPRETRLRRTVSYTYDRNWSLAAKNNGVPFQPCFFALFTQSR